MRRFHQRENILPTSNFRRRPHFQIHGYPWHTPLPIARAATRPPSRLTLWRARVKTGSRLQRNGTDADSRRFFRCYKNTSKRASNLRFGYLFWALTVLSQIRLLPRPLTRNGQGDAQRKYRQHRGNSRRKDRKIQRHIGIASDDTRARRYQHRWHD